ncbi:MAG: hypothetical protein GX999_07040 [Bacteroidales bacterium]|nr:hypothetical protein [Bacteroidales bacterium]
MKRYITALLITILITASLFETGGCSQPLALTSNQLGWINNNYQLDASLPDTPDTVPVYRLKYPDVTEEYALNIGDKFGVSEPLVDFKDSSGLYFLKNKHSDEGLEIALETGAILYHTNMKKLYPAEKPSLPDDEAAKDIALKFLEEKGLLTPDIRVKEVVTGGTYYYGVAHLAVVFDYNIGDFPAVGIGKKLSVRIGDEGEVVQAQWYHTEYETTDMEVSIKTAQQAYKELINNQLMLQPLGMEEGRKVRITEVSLGYYLDSMTQTQDYVYPVYVFEGEYLDTLEGNPSVFIQYVDAREGF